MINSTFGGFMTARQGMAASQHGLNLTGHNLTNSATEGYTRQRIDQVSLNFNGTYRYASQYNVNVGNGVLVTGTSQLRDPFLDLRYRNEVAHVGEQDVKLEALSDLQNILDEVRNMGDDTLGDGGIFNQLGDVLAKLQQLSNEVGNKEFDSMVRASCQNLTTLFQDYDKRIQEVHDNLAYDLENVDVPQVNKILKSIQELNKTIKSNEIMGNSALELKDQRNLLIDELSGYMKINVQYNPIKVSDSTTVDELTIYMIGSNGDRIALVADEQARQLKLSKDDNLNGPGNFNIGLTQLDPDDVELTSMLQAAENALNRAKEAAKPEVLEEQYNNAATAFTDKKNEWNTRNQTLTDLKDALADLETTVTEKETAVTTEEGNLSTAQEALDEAKKKLAELADTATDAEKTAAEKAVTDAEEAVEKAKERVADAEEATADARKDARAKGREVDSAQAAVDNYKREYEKAEAAYGAAVDALPSNPTELAAVFQNTNPVPTIDLRTDDPNNPIPLVGGDGAAKNVAAANQKVTEAQNALDDSIDKGKAIDCVNNLFVDGSLKGTLEMLNYSGEYDDPAENPANIRGINYFHNLLDTLANQFATVMNEANARGNGDALFESTDGKPIDAGNICIAKGWANNEYGIAPSAQGAAASSGSNDNILHMVSLFGEKMEYTTDTGTSLFNGTFEEFFTNIGNVLGLDIKSTTEKLDSYTQLASTIAQNREAVTGVSLDEEAMNIMRYQQSYNASARLMTALDEMLTTLISNTGVAGR